ncbi:MAG TPA: amidohydrolase family protein [Acidimicrobiales bacterium]|nr:amidohydrolase family protein [Acidimicrobiales bacterium]
MENRYTVISSDTHCGADVTDYRPYLASRFHDEFDAWAATYEVPFADLRAPTAYRSWDSDRRMAEHESDGIVAEVLFPNTVPPFFEEGNLVALPPGEADYERRWAGVQAHNRWLADFCAAVPGRRAGVVQVFVNRLEDALAEVSWAAEHVDVFGGVLLPSIPPGSDLPPLYDPHYDPLWRRCEELGAVVNVHAGAGLPAYGELEIARAIMLVELPWFSHRALWHLIFGGVLERFPALKVALTEQGVAWLPRGLETLDWFYGRMVHGGAAEALYFGAAAKGMSMKPSEYFARNVWVGASFLRSSESALRPGFGPDRIMWGDDYPHSEGTWPFSREALRVAFAGEDPEVVQRCVGANAAALYGFDLDALAPLAARFGPLVDEIAVPIDAGDYPVASTSNAFDTTQVLRAW